MAGMKRINNSPAEKDESDVRRPVCRLLTLSIGAEDYIFLQWTMYLVINSRVQHRHVLYDKTLDQWPDY